MVSAMERRGEVAVGLEWLGTGNTLVGLSCSVNVVVEKAFRVGQFRDPYCMRLQQEKT